MKRWAAVVAFSAGIVGLVVACVPATPPTETPVRPTAVPPEPTAPPIPTPRPIRPPNNESLWRAGHETGDLSQWEQSESGGVFNTGTGQATVTSQLSHSGQYSVRMDIRNASSETHAVRLFRWGETQEHTEVFASAYYYFPRSYVPKRWWNIFQFKSSRNKESESVPAWSVNVGNRKDGKMYLYLWDSIRERMYDQSIKDLPERTWVHIEMQYRRATRKSGRITVWQDGVKLWDLDGVQTAYSKYSFWSVNNYTDSIAPSDAVIYIDDAEISRERVGP